MSDNTLDLALFTMVADSNFEYDYNSEVYVIDKDELKNVISEQFNDYLKGIGFISSLQYYGLQFIDAYYINGDETQTGNGIFGVGLEIINKNKLIDYIYSREDIVNHYIRTVRVPNSDNENSIEDVISEVENGNLPQSLSYVLKKDFGMVGKELIRDINREIDYEELLSYDPVVSEDIQYLERLDYIENLNRNGLKFEGKIEGNNAKYYYFSRRGKNTFFYKVEIIQLATENSVEIEYVEE